MPPRNRSTRNSPLATARFASARRVPASSMPIPANVTKIINITDDDVKDQPRFKEIASEVAEFIGDSDLGGFNILRFDLPLLERVGEPVAVNPDPRLRRIAKRRGWRIERW